MLTKDNLLNVDVTFVYRRWERSCIVFKSLNFVLRKKQDDLHALLAARKELMPLEKYFLSVPFLVAQKSVLNLDLYTVFELSLSFAKFTLLG